MTEYRGIKGSTIQTIAGDPPAPIEGQVWYNTTSNVLKGYGLSIAAGAWSSGGAMSTGRRYAVGAGTSINTSLAAGGLAPTPFPTTNTLNTETYDGTSWTEVNNMNTAVQGSAAAGTQTSAFSAAGKAPGITTGAETWDGTSWSETTSCQTGRQFLGGAGTSTAAIIYSGGQWNQPPLWKLTEEWNGTSWTETNDLVDNHMTAVGSFGLTSTSAMCVSGYSYPTPPGDVTLYVEEWNGTSWSEKTAVPVGSHYMTGQGTVSSGMVSGGQTPSDIATSQLWNGTAWALLADLPTANAAGTSARNSPTGEGIYAGGSNNGGLNTTTSEWTTGSATQTFTSS